MPQLTTLEHETLARGDIERHRAHGVDLNPFSTGTARREWQQGFDGAPLHWAMNPEFSRYRLRGQSCAKLLQQGT